MVDPLGVGNQTGAAAHLLPTGRILVAGTLESGPPGNSEFYVMRLLEDGSVDGTFGSFGFTLVAFDVGGDLTDTLAAMTVDRNDRILLAGSVDVSATDIDFGVARLLVGGGLDTGFSGDGRATVPISTAGGIDGALAIAEYTTGRGGRRRHLDDRSRRALRSRTDPSPRRWIARRQLRQRR